MTVTGVQNACNKTCSRCWILLLHRRILRGQVIFPKKFSKAAKSFIQQLLERDPAKRLGGRGANEIKKHAFFKVFNFLVFNILDLATKCSFYVLNSPDPAYIEFGFGIGLEYGVEMLNATVCRQSNFAAILYSS